MTGSKATDDGRERSVSFRAPQALSEHWGTGPIAIHCGMMGDVADRFRKRARECRELAAQARTEQWRQSLLTLAQDLDDEAANVDAEENEDRD